MKKKNMYIGAALLTLGLGFSAMAFSGLMPIPFAGAALAAAEEEVDPEPEPEPELSYFAAPDQSIGTGDKLSSYPPVTEIWYNFDLGSSDESLPLGEGTVIIKKDGADFKSYEIGKAPEVYIGKNWVTRLYVSFGAGLEPGEYEVVIPEAAVAITYMQNSDSGDGKLVRKINREISTKFTVGKGFEYSVKPALGSKPTAKEMETITLTYPEGAVPAVKSSISLKQYSLGKITDVTTYSATVEGNVVTLKCADVKAIIPCSRDINYEYYYLDVPSGAVTITEGTESYPQGAFEIGNWNVVSDTAGIVFTPSFDTPDLKISDLETITVELPENMSFKNASVESGKTAFFKIFPNPVNTSYYYDYKIVSNEGKKYVCQLQISSSPTTSSGRPEICMKGSSTLRIASGVLQTVEYVEVEGEEEPQPKYTSVSQMDFQAYNLDGKDALMHYNSSPAPEGTSTGIDSFTLYFVQKARVANPDAYITLYLNGTRIKKVKVSENTTAEAVVGGVGKTSVAFSKKFVDADNAKFTDPGVYKFVVDAGAFEDVANGKKNEKIEVKVYNPSDFDYTVFPAPCKVEGTDPNYTVTPGQDEYPATIKEFLITFPNAVKVELNENMYSINQNSAIGQATYKNAANEKWAGPSNYSGYTPQFKYEVVGTNQVKVTCNEYVYPTPDNYIVGVKIYQGSFIITELDEDDVPTKKVSKNIVLRYPGLPMQKPAVIDAEGNAVEDIVLQKDATMITIKAPGSIFPHTVDAEAGGNEYMYVADAEGNKLFNVTQSHPDGPQTIMDLKFPRTLDPGSYKLVIPAGGLQGGSGTATSTMVVYNKEQFEYDFIVEPNYVDIDALFTRSMPEETFNIKTWAAGPTMYVLNVNEPISIKGNLVLLYNGEPVTELSPEVEGLINYIPGEVTTPDEPGELAEEGEGNEGNEGEEPVEPVEPAEPVVTPGVLQINLGAMEGLDEYLRGMYGTHSIKFPKGSIDINGDANNEYQIDYTFEALPVDFTYELDPAPAEGETVKDLSVITLTFPNCAAVTYSDNVAKLEMPDGTVLKSNWPDIADDGKGLVFKFNPKNGWVNGQYKFTVNPMTVCVDVDEDNPNFEGLEAYYTLKLPESIMNHISALVIPSAFECDPSNAHSPYGDGLGFIELGLDSDKITLNNDCEKTIDIYRDDKRIFSHVLSAEAQEEEPTIAIISAGGLEGSDEGLIEGPVNCSLYIISYNDNTKDELNVAGKYKVVIPDGAFKLNGEILSGTTLEYNYSEQSRADYSFELTPANGESLNGEPEDFFKTITLKAKAATLISYAGNSGATLVYVPATGESIDIPRDGYPETDMSSTISFKFGGKVGGEYFDWNTVGDGTYVFSVPKGNISINDVYFDDTEYGTGNFPAVTAVYTLSGATGVTMIGVEAAGSYNVFTIDGKAVKLNAAPAELLDLEEGLYIINGKKTYLRK